MAFEVGYGAHKWPRCLSIIRSDLKEECPYEGCQITSNNRQPSIVVIGLLTERPGFFD